MTNDSSAAALYNNIAFRTLLEAQWAVFFDTVGIKYRYLPTRDEPLPDPWGSCYEPKFLLSEYRGWFDVFPSLDSAQLTGLSCALVFANRVQDCAPPWPSGVDCYWLAFGRPGEDLRQNSQVGIFLVRNEGVDQPGPMIQDWPHTFAQCGHCGKIEMYTDTGDKLVHPFTGEFSKCCGLRLRGDAAQLDSPDLRHAYHRAQSLLT
jgi:hypothetical protein